MNPAWCIKFLDLAHHVAMWSKDPSTRVGCVIANDQKLVVGIGYNGFPRGVSDNADRYKNREEKYPRIVHAEVNAILNAVGPVNRCSLFSTLFPCCECAKVIIQADISLVVSPPPSEEMLSRWGKSFDVTKSMFEESGVEVWWANGYIEPFFDFKNVHPHEMFPQFSKTIIIG